MSTSPTGVKRLLTFGAIGAVAAALVNSAVYGIGRAAGLEFVVDRTAKAANIHLVHVVSFSLMTFAIGLAAALLATWIRRPGLRVLQITGAVVAVLTIGMDLSIDATVAAKATLALMHLVVGTAYVASLHAARRAQARPAARTDSTSSVTVPAADRVAA